MAARIVVWPRLVVADRGAPRARRRGTRNRERRASQRLALPSSAQSASSMRSRRDSRSARRVGRSSGSRPHCRRCAAGQHGMGLGASLAITSFAMLFALGLAGRGDFKGDGFVAASVVGVTLLVALFTFYPVARILVSAVQDRDGAFALGALPGRLFAEKLWGIGCIVGRRPLRRRVEHGAACAALRDGMHGARPRLCADRNPHAVRPQARCCACSRSCRSSRRRS